MRRIRQSAFPIHALAALAAVLYIWQMSQTSFVTTGVQFIGPVMVIMAVHLGWLAVSAQLCSGFSNRVYARSAATAIGMAIVIAISSVIAPQPAYAADVSDVLGTIAMAVFCVAVIALICALVLGVFYLIFAIIRDIVNLGKKDDDTPDSRLFDFGGIVVATAVLIGLSAEGVGNAYSFAATNTAQSTAIIDAAPDVVWTTMETATSPDFPLPAILSNFPKPTEVVVDEGVSLGALRQVDFSGREGAGTLTLQVTERTATRATFTVLSDTSPYAAWVAHNTLTYETRTVAGGTELSVTLDYDRVLAPSWFFTPVTKGAASLAMDVLARDVQMRAAAQ